MKSQGIVGELVPEGLYERGQLIYYVNMARSATTTTTTKWHLWSKLEINVFLVLLFDAIIFFFSTIR